VSYRPFRITGQGVLFNGETKLEEAESKGNQIARNAARREGLGALAWSHWRDTRSQLIYAWIG
jgi:hypothetical protein